MLILQDGKCTYLVYLVVWLLCNVLISVAGGGTFQKYSRLIISIEVRGKILVGIQLNNG